MLSKKKLAKVLGCDNHQGIRPARFQRVAQPVEVAVELVPGPPDRRDAPGR